MLSENERMKIMRRQRIALFVAMIIIGVAILAVVVAEINECGGVARCMGGFAREFDEARKGE
jgi:hypothetical protein